MTEFMCRVFWGGGKWRKGWGQPPETDMAEEERETEREREGGQAGPPFMRGCSSCAVAT